MLIRCLDTFVLYFYQSMAMFNARFCLLEKCKCLDMEDSPLCPVVSSGPHCWSWFETAGSAVCMGRSSLAAPGGWKLLELLCSWWLDQPIHEWAHHVTESPKSCCRNNESHVRAFLPNWLATGAGDSTEWHCTYFIWEEKIQSECDLRVGCTQLWSESVWEAEAGWLIVQGYPGLYNEILPHKTIIKQIWFKR